MKKRTTKSGKGSTRASGGGRDPRPVRMARGTEGLKKLFEHQLMDLYYVEKQLTKHLPKMAKAAVNEELSQAFTDHLNETEGQIGRLEKVFGIIGRPPKAQKCPAIDGILQEAKDLMEAFTGDVALDAALASAAQKVEHYEITSYGSLCAFAEQLGMDDVCDELEEILDEEKAADKDLSRLAETVLNIEAEESPAEDEDDNSQNGEGASSKEEGEEDEGKEEDDSEEREGDQEDPEEGAAGGSKDPGSKTKEYADIE